MKHVCNYRSKLSTPVIFTIFIICCMIVIFFFESIGLTEKDKIKVFREIHNIHPEIDAEKEIDKKNQDLIKGLQEARLKLIIYSGMLSQNNYANSLSIKTKENHHSHLGENVQEILDI